MKKITFSFTAMLVLLLLSFTCVNAQKIGQLWGMSGQGDSATGLIFMYNPLTGKDSVVRHLPGYNGPETPLYASLIQANDGNFYGTASNGGNNNGCVFVVTPSGTYILAKFNGFNGAFPSGGLIQGADGNLYGTATQGGTSSYGAIFKCTLGGTLTAIANFNNTNGGSPDGVLVQDKNGNLYGMTQTGGSGGNGTVFECTTAGTLKTLVNFSSGETPYGSLILVKDSLYGMTLQGGSGSGTIFKCDTLGHLVTMVTFTNNEDPYGALLLANDGNLYGMTSGGGSSGYGTIFKCTTTGTLTTLVNFANQEYPYGSLVQALDGNLYGMTSGGGIYNSGTVFKCTTSGTLTTIDNLAGATGAPYGSLIQALDGDLYGMSNSNTSFGSVFKCTTAGVLTNLFIMGATDIPYNPTGNPASGGLTQAYDGNLYGMAQAGGEFGSGALFRVSQQTGIVTDIVDFNDTNGANPLGRVMLGADSNLYGMTEYAGTKNDGIVFKYNTHTGNFKVLVNFNGTNGAYPYGNLIEGPGDTLYGMTEGGGSGNNGTIFKCTTKGALTTLYNFAGGEYPSGSLLLANDGNLYGMEGNNGSGSIFKCSTLGVFSTPYFFSHTEYPSGSLIQGVDGNLYGMTYGGGASSNGYIFKCTLAGALTDIFDFTGTNTGSHPYSSLIQATDSALYGMTRNGGGIYSLGSAFKCTTTGVFDTLFTFNYYNGGNSQYNDFTEVMNISLKPVTTCGGYILTDTVFGGGIGALKYKWSNGATTASIDSIKAGGTYSVTVTNASGFYLTTSTTLSPYVHVNASVIGGNPKCTGLSDGTVTAIAANGTPTYSYSWNTLPIQTNATATALLAGKYVVTVTDNTGCTTKDSATIIDPAKVSVSTGSKSNASCNGCTDGSATLVVTGGNKNIIVWSDSATGYTTMGNHTADTINHLAAGTYVCTVTDSCGDSKTDTIRITQPAPLGMQTISANGGVSIYPMPSNGHFAIAFTGGGYQLVTIYNETGAKVFSKELNESNTNSTLSIDLSAYADGIYFAQVITKHGPVNKKIVIQR